MTSHDLLEPSSRSGDTRKLTKLGPSSKLGLTGHATKPGLSDKETPTCTGSRKKSLNFMNLCLQLESLPLILMFIDFLIFAGDLALVLSTAETWKSEAKLVELVLMSLVIELRLGESMMQRLNMTKSSPPWSL